MKSIIDDDLEKLQGAFAAAHKEKEKAEVGELWPTKVMGHLRSMPPMYPRAGYLELLQQLVWRLAPVAAVLVLLLGAAVFQLDFTSEYELAAMFVEDPLDLSLLGDTLYSS